MTVEHIGQHFERSKVRAVQPGHAHGDHLRAIRVIRVHRERGGPGRLQPDRGAVRQLPGLDGAEQQFDFGEGRLGIHMPDHDQDRVVGRVPGVVKRLQHAAVVFSNEGRVPSASYA